MLPETSAFDCCGNRRIRATAQFLGERSVKRVEAVRFAHLGPAADARLRACADGRALLLCNDVGGSCSGALFESRGVVELVVLVDRGASPLGKALLSHEEPAVAVGPVVPTEKPSSTSDAGSV